MLDLIHKIITMKLSLDFFCFVLQLIILLFVYCATPTLFKILQLSFILVFQHLLCHWQININIQHVTVFMLQLAVVHEGIISHPSCSEVFLVESYLPILYHCSHTVCRLGFYPCHIMTHHPHSQSCTHPLSPTPLTSANLSCRLTHFSPSASLIE